MKFNLTPVSHFLFFVLLTVQSIAFADVVTKREFTKDGVIYIEETTKSPKGDTKQATYPKGGQGKSKTISTQNADENVITTTKYNEPGLNINISVTESKEDAAASSAALKELNKSISECKPYQISIPIPIAPKSTMDMQVHGFAEKKCKFTFTTPNNVTSCLFSDEQRNEFKNDSKAFEKYSSNEDVCKVIPK